MANMKNQQAETFYILDGAYYCTKHNAKNCLSCSQPREEKECREHLTCMKQNYNDPYLHTSNQLQALIDRAVVAERERVVDEILDFYKDSEFLAEYLSQLTDSEK